MASLLTQHTSGTNRPPQWSIWIASVPIAVPYRTRDHSKPGSWTLLFLVHTSFLLTGYGEKTYINQKQRNGGKTPTTVP